MKRRIITAAEDDGNAKLQAAMDKISDNFDFIMEGLSLLDRRGAEASNDALIIAERLEAALDEIIDEIGNTIGE